MAEVFLANRSDGEFEQQVAIKVSRTALDGRLAAFFHNERQILANLRHPNVAALYDGGTTGDGVPYVVMEYIEGVPLNDYVRSRKLDVQEILKLYLQVLDGVQTAHQSLVIHRDLKPGNILVTAEGIPKLLDFGIAARLAAPDGDATMAPGMTPAYASPEQLRGERLTASSDVYSLGVILYELLTGTRPVPGADLTPVQIDAAIARGRFELPSRRAAAGSDALRAAQLQGDLDAIVAHAIEEDPARRYRTAGALADDVRRHLRYEPVTVREATRRYRLGRFLRRHRAGAAAAGVAVLALVAAASVSSWQMNVARLERDRATEVSDFLRAVILSPIRTAAVTDVPGDRLGLGMDATISDLWRALETRAAQEGLSAQTRVQLLVDMSTSFAAQDQWADSERTARAALRIAGLDLPESSPLRYLARASLARSLHRQQRDEAGTEYAALLGDMADVDLPDGTLRAIVMRDFAVWLWDRKQLERARGLLADALDIFAASDAGSAASEFVYTLANAGLLDCHLGMVERCITRLDRAIAELERAGLPAMSELHRARSGAASYVGDFDAMLHHGRTAVAIAENVYTNKLEHARALRMEVSALLFLGRIDDAERALERLDAMEAELLPEDHHELADALVFHGRARVSRGDFEGALACVDRAAALRGRAIQEYDLSFTSYDGIAAEALLGLERRPEAQQRALRAYRFRRDIYGAELDITRRLEAVLLRTGLTPEELAGH